MTRSQKYIVSSRRCNELDAALATSEATRHQLEAELASTQAALTTAKADAKARAEAAEQVGACGLSRHSCSGRWEQLDFQTQRASELEASWGGWFTR